MNKSVSLKVYYEVWFKYCRWVVHVDEFVQAIAKCGSANFKVRGSDQFIIKIKSLTFFLKRKNNKWRTHTEVREYTTTGDMRPRDMRPSKIGKNMCTCKVIKTGLIFIHNHWGPRSKRRPGLRELITFSICMP